MDSVSACSCVTWRSDGSALSALYNLLYTHQPLLLSRALDNQMSIITLTFQCLVNVAPIVMHSPSVIEFKGSPFWDPIFSHINGRVVVLFLYPPEDLPESKGCHLQPDRTRVQPAAVSHCGYAPVEEINAQGQSHVPCTSVPRAEVLLVLTSLKTPLMLWLTITLCVNQLWLNTWCWLYTTTPFLLFKA